MRSRSEAADAARYTRPAVVLHWLVAALVTAQFSWGWYMQGIGKVPHGPRVDAYNLHKSVGLVILTVMLVRLGWRLAHAPPSLGGLPAWQRRLAHGTHALIYVALFVMPLAGYLGSAFSGYPVKWFGVTLPTWSARHDALKDLMSTVHLVTSFVLLAAVLLHLAGALRHALARDGYAARMTFGPRAGDRRVPWPAPARRAAPRGSTAVRLARRRREAAAR